MSKYDDIKQAIRNKQHVITHYRGHRREMCPHAIGTKNGRQQALFYQHGGSSSSGLAPVGSPSNWRCIPVDGLGSVEIRDGEWHTASNHSQAQTCVGRVDVEVSY